MLRCSTSDVASVGLFVWLTFVCANDFSFTTQLFKCSLRNCSGNIIVHLLSLIVICVACTCLIYWHSSCLINCEHDTELTTGQPLRQWWLQDEIFLQYFREVPPYRFSWIAADWSIISFSWSLCYFIHDQYLHVRNISHSIKLQNAHLWWWLKGI